jgi:hypothetical protein
MRLFRRRQLVEHQPKKLSPGAIGPNQLTPEHGFQPESGLDRSILKRIVLMRSGELEFAAGDTTIKPDRNGVARVMRFIEDVDIYSFHGRPVRRDGAVVGDVAAAGRVGDHVIGDLRLDDAAYEALWNCEVEPSCDYECDYETVGVGYGRMRNIRINAVELVPMGASRRVRIFTVSPTQVYRAHQLTMRKLNPPKSIDRQIPLSLAELPPKRQKYWATFAEILGDLMAHGERE